MQNLVISGVAVDRGAFRDGRTHAGTACCDNTVQLVRNDAMFQIDCRLVVAKRSVEINKGTNLYN